mmetsp:Transcript_705/g.1137  ORF Transcript_705/g.1137 Transcript_705/m.1137 type:complete len:227 (+) Transcript_705:348-1028(+)
MQDGLIGPVDSYVGMDLNDSMCRSTEQKASKLGLASKVVCGNVLDPGSISAAKEFLCSRESCSQILVWSQFTAAYCGTKAKLTDAFQFWKTELIPPGCNAIFCFIEIDGLLSCHSSPHDDPGLQTTLLSIESSMCEMGYDVRMGHHLLDAMTAAGLTGCQSHELAVDREFCFQGAAEEAVLDLWRQRVSRMRAFQSESKHGEDFLNILTSPQHVNRGRILMSLGES